MYFSVVVGEIKFSYNSGGKYDYLRWRNFMLVVIQSISSAAGVSLIRVNGMRVSVIINNVIKI